MAIKKLDKIKSVSLLVSLVFFVVASLYAINLYRLTQNYTTNKQQMASMLGYQKRFFDPREWYSQDDSHQTRVNYLNRRVSLVLNYGSTDNLYKQHQKQLSVIDLSRQQIKLELQKLVIIILVYIAIMTAMYFYYRQKDIQHISLLSLSILCLIIGLFTPMLEIGAIERDLSLANIAIEKEIMGIDFDIRVNKQFQGDIYFYYQSKSIVELIQLLFQQSNYVVGLSILIFSVFFPIIKTVLMGLSYFLPQLKNKFWYAGVTSQVSKWSMADVFVVAIFLGFLAFANMQAGVKTYSEVSIGLYFFLSYCLLSMLATGLKYK